LTTSSGSASNESAWHHRGEWLALAALICLCLIAPAFATDDTKFFNYLNNVERPQPLYFYNGYVPVLPLLVSYALKGLPLATQAIAYRIVPLAAVLLLYRELRALLGAGRPATEALVAAFAISLAIRVVSENVFANLAFSIWPAFLAACVFVVRSGSRTRYSAAATAAVLVAAASLPLSVLLVVVLSWQGLDAGSPQRRHRLLLAAAILAIDGLVMVMTPEPLTRITGLGGAWSLFASGFRDHKLANLIAVTSTAVLAICALLARRATRAAPRTAIAQLAVIGVGSVLLYPWSDRFVLYGGGFELRYTLVVLLCATVSALLLLAAAPDRTRLLTTGALAGAAVALLLQVEYSSLRGPLELALMKYRFLQVAQEFRATCSGGAMIFEYEDTSPVVLCHPGRFAPGYVSIRNTPPSIGSGSARDHELPGILVPEPLF
jgi:hypothetical protein